MSYTRQRTAPIREKRLGSIAAWYGSAASLVREGSEEGLVQRIRTFAQDGHSDLTRALELVGTLREIAVVVHGPAGCAAALHQGEAPPWIVTGITERDSILGGDSKLRAAILQACRDYSPKAIVVVSSPVVVINNDDIDSATEELREELGILLIPVYADGFRSKISATGLDVVAHALIKHLLPAARGELAAHVNLLALSENRASVAGLLELLSDAGIKARVFPRFVHVDEAEEIVHARLSIAINAAEADYTGQTLQLVYGTPYLNPAAPIGIAATASWLLAIGEALGLPVSDLIDREVNALQLLLAESGGLRGRKIFLNLSANEAFSFWHLARELGLEVTGIKLPFLDPAHVDALRGISAQYESLPVLVGDGNAFEEVSLLKASRPDVYIGHSTQALHAARQGIAVLALDELAYHGFAGVRNIVRQLGRKLANNSFARFLAAGDSEPYAGGWLKKSAYWYIKHEVK